MAKEGSTSIIEDPDRRSPTQPRPDDKVGQPQERREGQPETDTVDPKEPPVPAQPGMPDNSSPTPGTPKDLPA